ncbi:MAG: FMN-binding protein [Christensenella sp.]|nr:FMN-binding protein [Christensenella sp.]
MKQQKNDKSPKRKKRTFWSVLVIIVLLCAVGGSIAVISDAPNRRELTALTFVDIDFSNLHDGTYTGSFIGTDGNQRNATVEVTVSSSVITNIRVVKGAIDQPGAPLDLGNGSTVYDLLESAVDKKTLQVDVISGATLTSNAHLKALEDALLQAQKNP